MGNSTTSTQASNHRERQTVCSRLRRIFGGPPKEAHPAKLGKDADSRGQDQDGSQKGLSPYRHVPTGAQSSFLRTTTKRDMFELTGSGRKQPPSGEASVEASVEDLSFGNQSTENRPALAGRSESRLRHTEALDSCDTTAER